MEEFDYYSFMLSPTAKEIRNEGIIDKLWNIRTLNVPNNIFYKNYGYDTALNSALNTWKNQLLSLKFYYATAKKYYKYYNKTEEQGKKDIYDYWCRKNMEIIIILLSSQYDKALNIINILFHIGAERKLGFKDKILRELNDKAIEDSNVATFVAAFEEIDNNFGEIIKNIRNNVVHNYSEFYPSFEIKIDNGKEFWYRNDVITLSAGFNKIEECVNWLEKLMFAINTEVYNKYN